MTKRKSIGISEERHLKTERVAIEISSKINKSVKWTDLINHLIDNYLQEAKADYVESYKKAGK